MGIVSIAKNAAKKAAKKGADMVSTASSLSPNQLEKIEENKVKYLSAKPSMDDAESQQFVARTMGAIGIEVFQAYLPQISEIYLPVDTSEEKFDTGNRIRYFEVTKWVTDKEENNIDKLVNVYQALSISGCNIALIYHKTAGSCQVFLAISNMENNDPASSNGFCQNLMNSVKGNFPGAIISDINSDTPSVIAKHKKDDCYVASISNIAAEKSEKFISQSIEKLFDGVTLDGEKEYTIVLLAEPIGIMVEERKARLYELYSALAPYAQWQTNYTYTEAENVGSQATFGAQAGVGGGAHSDVNSSIGSSITHTDGVNQGKNSSISATTNILEKIPFIGKLFKGTSITGTKGTYSGTNSSDGFSNNKSSGMSAGWNVGFNFGVNFSRSSNISMNVGKNEGITNSFVNYGAKYTLNIIEEQIKRLEQSAALGMWDFAAYVISNDRVTVENTANMYLSLTQGEKSFMANAAVNIWDTEKSTIIMNSLKRIEHPVFGMNMQDEDWLMYPTQVTAATGVSGRELAYAMNFPKTSVNGLPVLESVSFGREVHRYVDNSNGASVDIGRIYHMRQHEQSIVSLNINDLAAHTFITGSTGAGKSNAIYQIINKLKNNGKKFLIIEPAKGEYKKIFGGYKDVEVYGTNRDKTKLLKINPFSFNKDIHVLEHIDRLVEIFNACWPMYAAMPAVLKDAIERIYIDKGWDLNYSVCEPRMYPTFYDLLEVLPDIMNNSLYSADTKSDYAGALITRVKSLTNGINGQILCAATNPEDENKNLFDNNVIVDISRVGSTETKSLIMGILIMKLQEYRMCGDEINRDLQHITVLEEAHNLLRRTSSVQTQESSNLQGKSVEMISNAIAEMRTYGEGFIIADQAPGLLDESVIRNTNTKIIFRLPDEDDRVLAGGSAALTDTQISEIAKLPLGVAVVYQNDWIEAVLCQFKKYIDSKEYSYKPVDEQKYLKEYFYKIFSLSDNKELSNETADFIREWIGSLPFSQYTKSILTKAIKNPVNDKEKTEIAYNVFKGQNLGQILQNNSDEKIGLDNMHKSIYNMYNIQDEALSTEIQRIVFRTILERIENTELANRYRIFAEGGRIA